MCGICGVHGRPDEQLIRAMTALMVHRGPDDEGYHLGDEIALGIRRLSIIDVVGGRQPIANEDGSVIVVLNGEIYNYRQLRPQLERRGHRFSTRSDTEVILHAYEEYGDAGVQLLRGMFAYALWDARRRRLVLARDRLGIKPLFYAEAGSDFLFASEAKALFCHPALRPDLDVESLDLYLTFQYVPGPQTLFRGVSKLKPGHLLIRENGCTTIQKYWSVVFEDGHRSVEIDEAVEEFQERLTEAVKLHLVSDVPVGALLSGGIDSSSVVATMAEVGQTRIRTFTVGFDSPGMLDEREDAGLVARHFGTDHAEIVTRPEAAELLPRLVWHLDEPIADPAALPTYLVCRYARQSVPVVLTGEGGDELLCGYPRYAWFLVARRLQRWLSPGIREGLLLPLSSVVPIGPRYRKALRNLLSERDDAERHLCWVANFDPALKRVALTNALFARLPADAARARVLPYLNGRGLGSDAELLHSLLALDLHTWLVDDVLAKVDRMSMAASVEARVPFLDHELLEFVATLPAGLKLAGMKGKLLLRRAMQGRLPRRTIIRRKGAFMPPVGEWLRGPLRECVHDVLLSDRVRQRGWFDRTRVESMISAHARGEREFGQPLWNLLCLELWANAFLDRSVTDGKP